MVSLKIFRITGLITIFLLLKLLPALGSDRVNNLNHFGIGARANGLNNAYTAISNDYTAPFWNPAVMDFFTTVKLGGMRTNMSLNREISFFSFVFPTRNFGAYALAWAGFGVRDIAARTSNTREPDSFFNYNENTFFISYAYRLISYLSIGANFKIFDYHTLDNDATGWGLDLALQFIPTRRFRFGFVAQDMQSQLNWSTAVRETFLPTFRWGISFDPFSHFSISCDYHQAQGQKGRFSMATELLTLNMLKLRFGLERQQFALGAGFTVLVKTVYLNFNYAMITDRLGQGVSDVFDMSLVF